MTNDDKIRDEKLQYDINRQTAKVSALSSGKILNININININILQVQKYYNAIYNHIKNSRINLHKEEKNPKEFRSRLSEILKRNQNCESKNQISTMKKYKTALQCLEKRS